MQVWAIKDNYRLGRDINSKVLAFAFGLSAEIESNLILQRTKDIVGIDTKNRRHHSWKAQRSKINKNDATGK